MTGAHKRMGDVWKPDRPLTIEEALGCQGILEADWGQVGHNKDHRLSIALTGVLVTVAFGAALRREEITRIEIGPIRLFWKDAKAPHIPLVLAGQFKKQTGEKVYTQPMALESQSGFRYRLWLRQAVASWDDLSVDKGPLFQRTTARGLCTRAKMGDLNPLFHDVLRRLQAINPGILPDSVDVEEEFSVSRSIRRGSTSQALNQKIPGEVVEANNRWKQHEKGRGRTPSFTMLQRYADACASVPLLIRYSHDL